MTERNVTLGIHSVSLHVLLAVRLSNCMICIPYTVDNVLPGSFTSPGQQNLKTSLSFQVSHLVENRSENSQARFQLNFIEMFYRNCGSAAVKRYTYSSFTCHIYTVK